MIYDWQTGRASLKRILEMLRDGSVQKSGYAGGNVLNLLCELNHEVRDYDFSHIIVRQAYLQGILLQHVNFAHAEI